MQMAYNYKEESFPHSLDSKAHKLYTLYKPNQQINSRVILNQLQHRKEDTLTAPLSCNTNRFYCHLHIRMSTLSKSNRFIRNTF